MKIINSTIMLRETIKIARRENKTIGFVPTMGYLHLGHAELIKKAKQSCDFIVVSCFVNPLQFGPNEDFVKYPRDLENDATLCKDNQVDVLFAPTQEEILPHQQYCTVNISVLGEHLCGQKRPGLFTGVCTIVSNLFNLVQPDKAFFGKKDIQQLKIIQQMVTDLNFQVEVIGVDTVRTAQGLALSSRNSYLSESEHKDALIVSQILNQVSQQIKGHQLNKSEIMRAAHDLIKDKNNARIDYLEIVTGDTLTPTEDFNQELIVAAAIFIGNTRLIDNLVIQHS